MTVVFPVHNGDVHLAIAHARWLAKLGKWTHKAIIAHDPTLNRDTLRVFTETLRKSFPNTSHFLHRKPPNGGWPMAPNWVWQQTAKHMSMIGSWLWMEPDAVALTPDWVQRIEEEYAFSGKAFMGPVVKDMGHLNGVSVYPRQTVELLPSAMSAKDLAWDYVAKSEMTPYAKDASHLMQHVWSIEGDKWSEVGGGRVPMLLTEGDVRRNLKPSAVMLHRVKDQSLLNLLMGGFKL
jgi:hypothetical protein